ncbi:MAG: hypothetical protein R3B93_03805 [Bacteroidia bacterium]
MILLMENGSFSRSNSNREPLIRAVVKIGQAVATVGVEEKMIEEVSLAMFLILHLEY